MSKMKFKVFLRDSLTFDYFQMIVVITSFALTHQKLHCLEMSGKSELTSITTLIPAEQLGLWLGNCTRKIQHWSSRKLFIGHARLIFNAATPCNAFICSKMTMSLKKSSKTSRIKSAVWDRCRKDSTRWTRISLNPSQESWTILLIISQRRSKFSVKWIW